MHVAAMLALYVSTVAILVLAFNVIDAYFPSPDQPADLSMIRGAIACLVVAFPLFLFFSTKLKQDYRRQPEKESFLTRKQLVYFTLFVAGLTIAATLTTLIYTLLQGEDLTLRFILKAACVLIVTGAVFTYYLFDINTRTTEFSRPSRAAFASATAATAMALLFGIMVAGLPSEQKLRNLDQQRVEALQLIQDQIIAYWRRKQQLPDQLQELEQSFLTFQLPKDPQAGEGREYSYQPLSERRFKLCANFNRASKEADRKWSHSAGATCFERMLDPKIYPQKKS